MEPSATEAEDLYASDAFRINYYKVLPCSKRLSHDWCACPFLHPNEKSRRRCLRQYKYSAIVCADMRDKGHCPRGDDCPMTHTIFEYWLHPQRYRTLLCKDGSRCHRRVCFFAHSLAELRVPTNDLPTLTGTAVQQDTTAAAAAATGFNSPVPAGFPTDGAFSCPSAGASKALWSVGSSNSSFTPVAGGVAYIASNSSSSSCTSMPYQLVNVVTAGLTDAPHLAQPNLLGSCSSLPAVNVNSSMLAQMMPAGHDGYGNSLPVDSGSYSLQHQQQQQQLLLEDSAGRLGSLTWASSSPGDAALSPLGDQLVQPLGGTGSFVPAIALQQQQQQQLGLQQQQQHGGSVLWLPQSQQQQQQWLPQACLPAFGGGGGGAAAAAGGGGVASAGLSGGQAVPYVYLPPPPTATAAATPALSAPAVVPVQAVLQPPGPFLLAPNQMMLLSDGPLMVSTHP